MYKLAPLLLIMLFSGMVLSAQETETTLNRTFEITIIEDFMIEGGVPNATLIQDSAGDDQVVLLYTTQGIISAYSLDGIQFENIGEPFTELMALYNTIEVFPSDVIIRQTSAGT